MTITIQELAALVGGQFALPADGATVIRGGAAIAEAGEGDITFFGNTKYLAALKTCRATAALVPLDFAEEIPPIAIRVENPSLAFSKLIEKFAPAPAVFPPGIHSSAIIGRDVTLADGVSIQPFVVIEDGASVGAGSVLGAHGYIGRGAKIGAGCLLHPRVTVGERCIVGSRVILHSGVVLGSDGFGFEFSGGKHVKIPQIGIVQLDDDVEIGANTTIDRARFGRTWIGEGTKIDNLVQIAHNVVIGKHSLVIALTGIAGSVKIGSYVTIAGQVGIVGHIEIGDQVIVAAKSGISKNIAAKEVVWGSPSQPMRDAKEQLACIRRLPKLFDRVKKLESTKQMPGTEGNFLPTGS